MFAKGLVSGNAEPASWKFTKVHLFLLHKFDSGHKSHGDDVERSSEEDDEGCVADLDHVVLTLPKYLDDDADDDEDETEKGAGDGGPQQVVAEIIHGGCAGENRDAIVGYAVVYGPAVV